MTQANVQSR